MSELSVSAAMARRAWEKCQNEVWRRGLSTAKHNHLRILLNCAEKMQVPEELYIATEYQIGRGILDGDLGRALLGEFRALAEEAGSDKEARTRIHAFLVQVVRIQRALEGSQAERGGRKR